MHLLSVVERDPRLPSAESFNDVVSLLSCVPELQSISPQILWH